MALLSVSIYRPAPTSFSGEGGTDHFRNDVLYFLHFWKMWNEQDPKINGAQQPVIHFFLQKVREAGTVQFYKFAKVKESELLFQLLTVVDLNYCDVPRVPRI